jgi:hypothetical protein
MGPAIAILVVTIIAVGVLAALHLKSAGLNWDVDEKIAVRSTGIALGLILVVGIGKSLVDDAAEPIGVWSLLWVIPALGFLIGTVMLGADYGTGRTGTFFNRLAYGRAGSTGTPPAKKIQYGSAIALVAVTVLGLVILYVMSLFATPGDAPNQAAPTQATTTQAAPAPTTTAPVASPAPTKATTAAPKASEMTSKCGVTLVKRSNVYESTFHPTGVERCVDGKWALWSGEAPAKISVMYSSEDDTYIYGAFTWKGNTYETRVKKDPDTK